MLLHGASSSDGCGSAVPQLSIRMVAGFAEIAEKEGFFGCGVLQPSEFASAAIHVGTVPHCRLGTTKN